MVSVGLDQHSTINVWDWKRGKVLATVRGHSDRVRVTVRGHSDRVSKGHRAGTFRQGKGHCEGTFRQGKGQEREGPWSSVF